jgi:hypothetical protein
MGSTRPPEQPWVHGHRRFTNGDIEFNISTSNPGGQG